MQVQKQRMLSAGEFLGDSYGNSLYDQDAVAALDKLLPIPNRLNPRAETTNLIFCKPNLGNNKQLAMQMVSNTSILKDYRKLLLKYIAYLYYYCNGSDMNLKEFMQMQYDEIINIFGDKVEPLAFHTEEIADVVQEFFTAFNKENHDFLHKVKEELYRDSLHRKWDRLTKLEKSEYCSSFDYYYQEVYDDAKVEDAKISPDHVYKHFVTYQIFPDSTEIYQKLDALSAYVVGQLRKDVEMLLHTDRLIDYNLFKFDLTKAYDTEILYEFFDGRHNYTSLFSKIYVSCV